MICIEHWDPDVLRTPKKMQRIAAEGAGCELT